MILPIDFIIYVKELDIIVASRFSLHLTYFSFRNSCRCKLQQFDDFKEYAYRNNLVSIFTCILQDDCYARDFPHEFSRRVLCPRFPSLCSLSVAQATGREFREAEKRPRRINTQAGDCFTFTAWSFFDDLILSWFSGKLTDWMKGRRQRTY